MNAAAKKNRASRRHTISDWLAAWLPVWIMAFLALGTWYLVRNAPRPLAHGAPSTPADTPDYTMRDFSITRFDASGRLSGQLHGSLLRHWPENDTLEIDAPRLLAVSPAGQHTHASAQRALANSDASEVQLLGNAQVTRDALQNAPENTPRLHFAGEHLHLWPQAERLRSDTPVTLTRGSDQIRARRMEYDRQQQVLQLHGQVRARLENQAKK